MTNTIGIDIGTSHTVISEKGGEILLCEPTIAAVNPYTGELIAAGSEALSLCGSICSDVRIVAPVKNGVVCDFDVMRMLLKNFLNRILKNRLSFFSPKAIACVPYGINDMQAAETLDAVRSAGIRDVKIQDRPLMSAIGAGLDVTSHLGSLVVEIGAGITEAAAICMGSVVSCETIATAGDKMDDAIAAKIMKRCAIKIGKRTAEAIKLRLPYTENIELCGRSITTGLPAAAAIPAKELIRALDDDIKKIVLCVSHLLAGLPSALSADIIAGGIVLTGGSSRITGLAEELSKATGAETIIAERGDLCAAKGLGKYIGEKLSDAPFPKDNTA